MYFIKIHSNNYKNSLQKGIEETFKPLNHMLVADPVEFLKHVQQKVTELNAKNPRCTPARVDYYFEQHTGDLSKSVYVFAGDWTYNIHLHLVIGELVL